MELFITGGIIGMVLGATFGVMIMSLLFIAKEADKRIEENQSYE